MTKADAGCIDLLCLHLHRDLRGPLRSLPELLPAQGLSVVFEGDNPEIE